MRTSSDSSAAGSAIVFEVGPLAFDIDEQRLDPGLIDSQQLHAHAI